MSEMKDQLPDFETYSLTEEEDSRLKWMLRETSKVTVLQVYDESMALLKLDWVQEKLKKRYENIENRNWAEFWI